MKTQRRKFSSDFKVKVALEAIKEQMTLLEISSKYQVHPTQIGKWKAEFLENAASVFESGRPKKPVDSEETEQKLYSKIGELQVQVDFLKKVLAK